MLSVAAGTGVGRHGGEAAAWQLLQACGIIKVMRSGVAAHRSVALQHVQMLPDCR